MDGNLSRAEARLNAAVEALRGAMSRHRVRERSSATLRAEAQAMADDRARLAAELDRIQYRAKRLEEANRQVMTRVEQVMGSVRDALEQDGQAQRGGR